MNELYKIFIEKISIEKAYNFYTDCRYNKNKRICSFCKHKDCFSIYPSKVNNKVCLYKCHSCKKTSNVIGFLKDITKIKNTKDFCNRIIQDFNLKCYVDNYTKQTFKKTWIPAPQLSPSLVSSTSAPINFWPTINDCINFKNECQEKLSNIYPYSNNESYFWKWCDYRGFTKANEYCDIAIDLLQSTSFFLFPQPCKYKNAFQQAINDSIHKHQQIQIHNIGIPIQNIDNELVAIQFLVLPQFFYKNKEGKTISKLFTGSEEIKNAKGFTIFRANHFDTFPFDYGKFIIVESIANAISLSMIGLNTICIYSTSNLDLIPELKLKYDIVLWLNRDAQIVKGNDKFSLQEQACRDYDIEGIYWNKNVNFWNELKSDKYDTNDLFNETYSNGNHLYPVVVQEYLEQVPFLSYSTENTIYKALTEEKNTIQLILAPTGVGKTMSIIQKLQKEERHNTIFAYTVRDTMHFKKQLRKYSWIISTNSGIAKNASYQNTISGYDITTIARLNYWGHSIYIYPCAPLLLDKHFIYLDNVHNLFKFYHFNHALCACYQKQAPTKLKVKMERHVAVYLFSHNIEKYFDNSCIREKKYRRFGFMNETIGNDSFKISKSFAGHTIQEWIENKELYKHVIDTVFACDLESQLNIENMPEPDNPKKSKFTNSYFDFLKELLTKTLKPRITIEMPIYKETNEPLSYKEYVEKYKEIENKLKNKIIDEYIKNCSDNLPRDIAEQMANIDYTKLKQNVQRELNKIIKFPRKAPWIPYFSGYNILPFLQLLEKPRAINMLTATMTEKHIKLLKEISILKNYKLNIVKIPYVPVKYNVTILMLNSALTNKQQAKLLELLDKQKAPPILSVSYKRYNANDVKTKLLSRIYGENFMFYEDKTFHQRPSIDDEDYTIKPKNTIFHIVTYSHASILEGYNMPFHEIAIVDAGLFIAKANMALNTNASETEKLYQHNVHASNEIKQIVGRLFRPFPEEQEKINPNKTLISKKHIVLFLHNAKQLKYFRLDDEIINDKPIIIKETDSYSFASTDEKQKINTICEAILNAYNKKTLLIRKKLIIK